VTPEEKLETLANLPDDAMVMVSVRLGDWRAAQKARAEGEGPEYVGSSDASRMLGFSPAYWQKLAKRGRIPGAVQDDGGNWRLPLASCRSHIRAFAKRSPSTPPPSAPVLLSRGRARVPKRSQP
jgi:hypothetical protein